jgi:hypothetical protein
MPENVSAQGRIVCRSSSELKRPLQHCSATDRTERIAIINHEKHESH